MKNFLRKTTCVFSSNTKKSLSSFIDQKIDNYFKQRTSHGIGIVNETINYGYKSVKNAIYLNSNDYLRISSNPIVLNEKINYLKSTKKDEETKNLFYFNQKNLQAKTEQKYASYIGKEAVFFTQFGFLAKYGLTKVLLHKTNEYIDNKLVFYIDELAHPAFTDGILSSLSQNIKIIKFKHNNIESLRDNLIRHGPGIIIVESVYGNDGNICNLNDICYVKNEYNCLLIVDETHSLGLYGDNGSGLVNYLKLNDYVDFITASLTKTFCTRAGLVVSSKKFLNFIRDTSTPSAFSSTLLNFDCIQLKVTLSLLRSSDLSVQRVKLFENSNYLRRRLIEMGYHVRDLYNSYNLLPSASPIIGIGCKSEKCLSLLRNELYDENILCSLATNENSPKYKYILRLSMHSDLSYENLKHICNVFERVQLDYISFN